MCLNGKSVHYFKCAKQKDNTPNAMNEQGNMVSQKENDNSPKTKFKVMEYCDLNTKQFKITIKKKLN